MMLVNLIPYRERNRQRQRQRFLADLWASFLLCALLCVLFFAWYRHFDDRQQARNGQLQEAITHLDRAIQDKTHLQQEIAVWQARLAMMERLQADRNLPVHLIQELALQMPEGIVLSGLKQDRQDVLLTGTAQSQEQVTELLNNLASSEWMSRPALVEIATAVVNPDQPQGARFAVRVLLGAADAHGLTDALNGFTKTAKVE
jgi:type IV pilus assembly protein PilN